MKRLVLRGELLVLAAAFLWSLIGVCTRELGSLGLPAEQVGAWRALIGGACFVAHLSIYHLGAARSRPVNPGPADASVTHSDVVATTVSEETPTPTTTPGPDPVATVGAPTEGAAAELVVAGGVAADGVVARDADTATTSFSRYRPVLGSLVVFCVVGVVVFYASLPLAVETGGISLAWVLLYTAPIWVSIGAALFLGERVGVAGVLAVAVSVGGVVALVSSVGGTVDVTAVSVTWGLASGLSYSIYYLVGRRLFASIGAVTTYALALPVGGVVLAVIVGLEVPGVAMVPWLLFLGFGCTYLPYLAFGHGIQHVPSSRAVVIATVEPVLAILIGVAVYGESLGVLGVLGGAAVLVAAVAVGLRRA